MVFWGFLTSNDNQITFCHGIVSDWILILLTVLLPCIFLFARKIFYDNNICHFRLVTSLYTPTILTNCQVLQVPLVCVSPSYNPTLTCYH